MKTYSAEPQTLMERKLQQVDANHQSKEEVRLALEAMQAERRKKKPLTDAWIQQGASLA